MIRIYSGLIALSLFVCSCSKNNDRIDAPTAIKQLIVQKSIDCECDPFVDLYSWRNQSIYVFGDRGPACDSFPRYYDQNGNAVTMPANYNFDDFLQEARRIKNIWTCKK